MTTLTNTQTLMILPPELLLTIISHLPTLTSLHALALTSRPLAHFIHTHASTICNTRILSNALYLRASSILKSTYIDGWLVPQHRSIFHAEELWKQEQLASRNASRASSPQYQHHHAVLNINNCCFRSASLTSNHSVEDRAPRLRFVGGREDYHQLRDSGYISSTPSPTPQDPTTTTIPSTLNTIPLISPSQLYLSNPGPHYIAFLTRYAHEIVTRWEMDTHHTIRPLTPIIVRSNNYGTQLGPIVEVDDEAEMERMEERFAEMLRLYCVKNWMRLCEGTFGGDGRGEGMRDVNEKIVGAEDTERNEDVKVSRRAVLVERTKNKVNNLICRSKSSVRKILTFVTPTPKPKCIPPPRKRLLFGEIDTDSASSLASVGIIPHGSDRNSSSVVVEKDCWVKSLLWYYGVSERLAIGKVECDGSLEELHDDDDDEEVFVDEKFEQVEKYITIPPPPPPPSSQLNTKHHPPTSNPKPQPIPKHQHLEANTVHGTTHRRKRPWPSFPSSQHFRTGRRDSRM